ncbi:MAG TPA: AAA family ATPase [Verrucomicrobiae bacterium]|nr:AAA family ATPase [Verrucomicrobiae bacterium]
MKEANRRVLAFVGMPGSGKGTCTDYLRDTYSWPVVHFGNMVYEEVERRGLDIVNDEKFVREDMRNKEGKEVLAKHAARRARQHHAEGAAVVVLDGLYSWSEYRHLAQEFGDSLTVVAVVAPRKLRHQRALERKDAKRTYTLDQLVTRDQAEIENLEKGGPIAYADYFLLNDSTVKHLIDQLNKVLEVEGLLS